MMVGSVPAVACEHDSPPLTKPTDLDALGQSQLLPARMTKASSPHLTVHPTLVPRVSARPGVMTRSCQARGEPKQGRLTDERGAVTQVAHRVGAADQITARAR